MLFDYKKEYKEFYMPKNVPEIVAVPKMNYIADKKLGVNNKKKWLKGKISEGHIFRKLDVNGKVFIEYVSL